MAAELVKFLLVDDAEENLVALEALLRRDGLELLKAHSGAEALELLLVHEVALAFLDVQMPDMDGFECTALIRHKLGVTGLRLPIIAMTAHAMDGDEARCLAAGMDGYLSKPIQADVLFDTLERHLGVAHSAVPRPTPCPVKPY